MEALNRYRAVCSAPPPPRRALIREGPVRVWAQAWSPGFRLLPVFPSWELALLRSRSFAARVLGPVQPGRVDLGVSLRSRALSPEGAALTQGASGATSPRGGSSGSVHVAADVYLT